MRSFIGTIPYASNPERAAFAPLPSDAVDARVLAANTAESHTVPTGAKFVAFSATADFYVKFGGTAAVPAADVTDGSASELNPTQREIPSGVTAIGLIAPAPTVVTLAFYL